MTTDKKRLSIGFSEEDYQWLEEMAELTGNSRAGVLRQIVRGLRLGRPGLLAFGSEELLFADEPAPTDNEGTEKKDDETDVEEDEPEEGGLEAFKTQ